MDKIERKKERIGAPVMERSQLALKKQLLSFTKFYSVHLEDALSGFKKVSPDELRDFNFIESQAYNKIIANIAELERKAALGETRIAHKVDYYRGITRWCYYIRELVDAVHTSYLECSDSAEVEKTFKTPGLDHAQRVHSLEEYVQTSLAMHKRARARFYMMMLSSAITSVTIYGARDTISSEWMILTQDPPQEFFDYMNEARYQDAYAARLAPVPTVVLPNYTRTTDFVEFVNHANYTSPSAVMRNYVQRVPLSQLASTHVQLALQNIERNRALRQNQDRMFARRGESVVVREQPETALRQQVQVQAREVLEVQEDVVADSEGEIVNGSQTEDIIAVTTDSQVIADITAVAIGGPSEDDGIAAPNDQENSDASGLY